MVVIIVAFSFVTGKCVHEGDERPTAGDLYVQCVKEARLRGRFPVALSVHRLTQASNLFYFGRTQTNDLLSIKQ